MNDDDRRRGIQDRDDGDRDACCSGAPAINPGYAEGIEGRLADPDTEVSSAGQVATGDTAAAVGRDLLLREYGSPEAIKQAMDIDSGLSPIPTHIEEVEPIPHARVNPDNDYVNLGNPGRLLAYTNGEYVRCEGGDGFVSVAWSSAMPLQPAIDALIAGASGKYAISNGSIVERDNWVEGTSGDVLQRIRDHPGEVTFARFDGDRLALAWRSNTGAAADRKIRLHECRGQQRQRPRLVGRTVETHRDTGGGVRCRRRARTVPRPLRGLPPRLNRRVAPTLPSVLDGG